MVAVVLALMTLGIYLVMIQIPFLRDFYEMTPLPGTAIAALLAVAGAWTAVVHLLRRTGIVARIEDVIWTVVVRAWRRIRPAPGGEAAPARRFARGQRTVQPARRGLTRPTARAAPADTPNGPRGAG